jgi:polar amino acid transport system substrate-binding protein
MYRMACAATTLLAAILVAATPAAFAQNTGNPMQKGPTVSISPDVVKDLIPTGKLRAAINYGNTVLVQRSASGELSGITVDLARELAKRLNVPVELVPFDGAAKSFTAVKSGDLDVGFFAIEPVRAAEIAFTPPYVIIEGTYMVPADSPLKVIADVDREGVRIAVGKGSAYDLYLTRTLKHATLVRAPTSVAAMEMFLADKLEAGAGVKQPIVAFAQAHPGVRAMEGRFQAIEQAMGTAKPHAAGAAYLTSFIEEMKASGFVAGALKRANQPDAAVAPPATN